MQLKLDQLITIAWDQDSGGHVSIVSALNVWPNGAVSVFLKERNYFQSIMGDSPLGAALNPSVNPNISNVMTCQVNIARDQRSHPSRFSFLEQKVFSVLKKICVSRRRLRRQWEWTGRAWLPSSYSTSQCSWWKTWQKKKLLYHHLLILAYVQSVTVQAFLGCANVPIIFNYRHIGTIGT